MKKTASLLLCFISIFSLFTFSAFAGDVHTDSESYDIRPLAGEPLDYSRPDNWLFFDDDPDQEVDLIFLYPTITISSPYESGIAVIDDEFISSADWEPLLGSCSAFVSYTNLYTPIYRQVCYDKLLQIGNEFHSIDPFMALLWDKEPRTDIYAALDCYFNNINSGRPFILQGSSQGSFLLSIVLEEYMRVHPEYLERMVAAYAIGAPFDMEYIERNPHLRYAQGETDTGCIISWNTEGPDAAMPNLAISPRHPYCINPLNWKTDDSYAPADENRGVYIYGQIIPGLADAQIDPERGALICRDCEDYYPLSTAALFGDKSLHGYDYALYFENLRENGQKRIDSFFGR